MDPVFNFEIIDDEIGEEREEYFEIVLEATRNAVFFPYAVGRVTILDDDIRKYNIILAMCIRYYN